MEVKINDKTVKFTNGLYFLGKVQKEWDTDLMGLLQRVKKNPISDIVDLMYYSIQLTAELDEIGVSITKREFVEYLEKTNDFDTTDGLLALFVKKLVETIEGHFLPSEEPTEEGSKKK